MKISICTNLFHPHIGGAEAVTKRIADFLAQRGHQVFIHTRQLSGRKANYPYEIKAYHTGDYKSFHNTIRTIQPDVVFIYSDVFDFFRQSVAEHLGFPLIVALCGANWMHDNKSFVNVFLKNLYKIKHIICHSAHDRDYKLCSGEIKKKTIVIPNGVDISEFDNNALTRKDLLSEHVDKRWILNVSNFFPGKGQEHLVKILSQSSISNAVYIQISSDIIFPIGRQLEESWKKQATLKLQQKMPVKLIKNPSREKVVGFIKQCNVLTLTSEKEVAPLILLESMAATVPWVSTNVGNTAMLKGGICITAPKTSQDHSVFDDRVCNLFSLGISDSLRTPVIAEDGRRQIESELNWNTILPTYASLIEN